MSVQQTSKEEYLRKFLGEEYAGAKQKEKGKKKKVVKERVKLIDDDDFRRGGNKKDSDEDLDLLDEENMPVFVDTADSTKLTPQQRIQALTQLTFGDPTDIKKKDSSSSRSGSSDSSDSDGSKKKKKKSKKSMKKIKRRHDSDSEADDEIMKLEKESTQIKKFKNQMNKALGMGEATQDQADEGSIVSGTVHRDEMGRKIDINAIIQEKLSKKEQVEELKRKNQERIDMWGKGMKQKEDRQKQRAAMQVKETYEGEYTISKEADIELMKQERFNDPMRHLIQEEDQKIAQAKVNVEKKAYCRLVSRFPGVSNRFDIKPGHMWDGVDRGNGAEKRYFNMVATKKDRNDKAREIAALDL